MRIGVFCSGGDAPGMNPCVRAVVRTAVSAGHEVVGIRHGYEGLLNESFFLNKDGKPLMTLRSVSDLSRRGGTILHSRRCDTFRTEEGQKLAAANLRKHKIDALIPIGGDGTFHGAVDLVKHWDGQIVGCPGTIDNDLLGTDLTIGFATAVNTAVEAIDKLRDTAQSHERMFLVEVMGRHSGYIGLFTALAGGAEVVCIPETTTDIKKIVEHLQVLKNRGKQSIMMVVSEGDELGNAHVLNEDLIKAGCPFQTRVLTLGHLQRGGSPVPADRILATELGNFAVRSILDGHTGVMAGRIHRDLVLTEFTKTYATHKPVPDELVRLLETMAR
jgi:6-phosphofructokinase 1